MTTNYIDTLITVAEDSPTQTSVVPDLSKPSVAAGQFEMVADHPYEFTSDDVIFARVADKQGLRPEDRPAAQAEYFSTGRACLRTSPLAKQYGWGIHSDKTGAIALVPMESDRYTEFLQDDSVKKIPAMRKSRR